MYIPDFGGDRDGGGTEKTGTEKNCISGETAGFGELRVPENPTHPWRRNLNNSGVSPCPGRRKLEQRKLAVSGETAGSGEATHLEKRIWTFLHFSVSGTEKGGTENPTKHSEHSDVSAWGGEEWDGENCRV